jgi:hypothetical protein
MWCVVPVGFDGCTTGCVQSPAAPRRCGVECTSSTHAPRNSAVWEARCAVLLQTRTCIYSAAEPTCEQLLEQSVEHLLVIHAEIGKRFAFNPLNCCLRLR